MTTILRITAWVMVWVHPHRLSSLVSLLTAGATRSRMLPVSGCSFCVYSLLREAGILPEFFPFSMRRTITVALLLVVSFVLGYDYALTRLAYDMELGRTSLRDNRLIMEIRHRRVLSK